ncbi:MAG: sulfotransferase [Oceanicaulis sp.]|nr:sulfotransferase [Oceanicaulis sp.]
MNALTDKSIALMREANDFFTQQEPLSASLKYHEALHTAPTNAVALHNLAALRMSADSPAQRMSGLFLLKAAASLLKSDQYHADFAIALYNIGKPKLALRYIDLIQPGLDNPASLEPLKTQIASKANLNRSALKSFLARKPVITPLSELNKLAQRGEFDRIIALFENQLFQDIADFQVWRLLAHAYRMTTHVYQAQGAALAAMALAPDDVDLHILNIELITFSGLNYLAAASAKCSLQRIPSDTRLMTAASYALSADDQPDKAVSLYETASDTARQDPRFRLSYANSLSDMDRHKEAQHAVLELAREHPTDETILLSALRILNKPGAGAQMKQVIDIMDENDVQTTHVAGHFFRAMMHNYLGETDKALAIVERSFDPDAPVSSEQANFAMIAGKLYDKNGQYDKAFDLYKLGNALHAQMAVKTGRLSPASYPAVVKSLRNDLLSRGSDSLEDHTVNSASHAPKIVFMYSFPRSGTTLLDTIFRTHSKIEVLEEQPVIRETLLDARFKDKPRQSSADMDGVIQAFYRTDPELLQKLYFKNLVKFGRYELDPEITYVDKMPLNTPYAALIKYMFPDAKHVFSLRDPADVITSCFAQNFVMNHAMYHFTSIERAVALYDQVMSFWVKAEEILDLDVSYVRYEDLITDLQGVVQPVVEGLGLPWEDGLVDFWKTAREREVIRTASADQVIQKLYTTSKGRWTRYSALTNGALDALEPWRKHFGYA